MLRILRYLPVHCAKGAEFAAFAVCFLEFSGWTPSLLVVVRIQRISRDSWKLWANCVKSGSFAPIFLGSLAMVRDLKLNLDMY